MPAVVAVALPGNFTAGSAGCPASSAGLVAHGAGGQGEVPGAAPVPGRPAGLVERPVVDRAVLRDQRLVARLAPVPAGTVVAAALR